MPSKKVMASFLAGHARHCDRAPYRYALNVKIHSIALNKTEREKMYTILAEESLSNEFYFDVRDILLNFESAHPGFKIYQGGRSDGWLELHGSELSEHIKDEAELLEINADDLKARYDLVRAFDEIMTPILSLCREYAKREVQEKTYTIKKTRKVFKEA